MCRTGDYDVDGLSPSGEHLFELGRSDSLDGGAFGPTTMVTDVHPAAFSDHAIAVLQQYFQTSGLQFMNLWLRDTPLASPAIKGDNPVRPGDGIRCIAVPAPSSTGNSM